MSLQGQDDHVERAVRTADGLKAGTWESVEALALLAIESGSRPHYDAACRAADALKAGNWESVRALALLARAEREMSHDRP